MHTTAPGPEQPSSPRTRARDRLATLFATALAALPLLAGAGVVAVANQPMTSPGPETAVSASSTPGVSFGEELVQDLRERVADGR